MVIVSISLNEELLEDLDKLQIALGMSGRSETIRAGVKMLVVDTKEKSELKGELNSILLVVHQKKAENTVTRIKHEFDDIITTQTHSHLRSLSKKHKCLDIFVLEGDSTRVKKLFRAFQSSRKMDYLKLVVA
ncbi:MAG: CopG family ribbon-helix-helix protein [Candidatus Micrarchaeota archaeon]